MEFNQCLELYFLPRFVKTVLLGCNLNDIIGGFTYLTNYCQFTYFPEAHSSNFTLGKETFLKKDSYPVLNISFQSGQLLTTELLQFFFFFSFSFLMCCQFQPGQTLNISGSIE